MYVTSAEKGKLKELEGRNTFFLIMPEISKNMFVGYTIVWPGGQTKPAHSHDNEEVYFIARGKGVQVVNNEEREVSAGDVIFIPPGATHLTKNPNKTPLEFLWVVSPPAIPAFLKSE